MIGDASRARNPAGRGGLFSNLFGLANALATFFETRAALFASESKRAAVQFVMVAGGLIAAVVFFALGYLFFVATVVVAIAHATNLSLEWVAIGAAAFHFFLALLCALIGLTRVKRNPFPETAAELRKDREWLRNLDATSRPMR